MVQVCPQIPDCPQRTELKVESFGQLEVTFSFCFCFTYSLVYMVHTTSMEMRSQFSKLPCLVLIKVNCCEIYEKKISLDGLELKK